MGWHVRDCSEFASRGRGDQRNAGLWSPMNVRLVYAFLTALTAFSLPALTKISSHTRATEGRNEMTK